MKRNTFFELAGTAALAAGCPAFSQPTPIPASAAVRLDPVRVAGIRALPDGRYEQTTPWRSLSAWGSDSYGELVFDALQVGPDGTPIGGPECGLPGDEYRWYWGTNARFPIQAEDIELAPEFAGVRSTGASFGYWWSDNGTGESWYIALVTFEQFGAGCSDPFAEEFYGGVILEYPPAESWVYYTQVDVSGDGLYWQMPVDRQGGYRIAFGDAFDGENLTLAAGPCHMVMYGTSDDGGLPGRPGTNTADAWMDGWNSGNPNGVLEGGDDCAEMRQGVCPDPLANGMSFFATGADCTADCDASGGLDLFDFLCFVNAFNGGDLYADCDASGDFGLFDFFCFLAAFNQGC